MLGGSGGLALAQADQPRVGQPLGTGSSVSRSARWSDLWTRIASAAVMVPLALGCVWLGGIVFAAMVALLSVGMAFEWLRLCQAPPGPRSVLMFASLPLAVFLTAVGAASSALGLLLVITVVSAVRLRAFSPARPLPFGVPYIGLGAIALVWLRLRPLHGLEAVVLLLLVIWATDIGAYGVGRLVGGARLAPRISPGKTWSGAIGGLLAGMAAGVAAAVVLGVGHFAWQAALLAGTIGCVGQAGDLFESLLKRHFKVKDSGHLIPGHGGLLDRLDAVLAAAPVAALLALLFGVG
jgi:phosphatidate cytidylyltransferase